MRKFSRRPYKVRPTVAKPGKPARFPRRLYKVRRAPPNSFLDDCAKSAQQLRNLETSANFLDDCTKSAQQSRNLENRRHFPEPSRLYKAHLHHNPTHVAAQLDFQNAFGTMHRKACIRQLEQHIILQEQWFLATKHLWSRAGAIPVLHEDHVFETSDGVPPEDPLSTLAFATAMSLLMNDIIRSKAPNVSMVAYVNDTVLLGPAKDVTQAMSEIQAETATGGLKLQKAKTQVWKPTQKFTDNELFSAPFKEGWGIKGAS